MMDDIREKKSQAEDNQKVAPAGQFARDGHSRQERTDVPMVNSQTERQVREEDSVPC